MSSAGYDRTSPASPQPRIYRSHLQRNDPVPHGLQHLAVLPDLGLKRSDASLLLLPTAAPLLPVIGATTRADCRGGGGCGQRMVIGRKLGFLREEDKDS